MNVLLYIINDNFTFMQRIAACLASWFSVDGPLSPDCSAPLNVNQLTKLNTADSPLTSNGGEIFIDFFCLLLAPLVSILL